MLLVIDHDDTRVLWDDDRLTLNVAYLPTRVGLEIVE